MQMTRPSRPHAVAESAAPEIRLDEVFKAFEGRPVLRGVTMEISRGEIVALVGGSGSGKTVLMRHILGHFRPDAGHVLVADHESRGSPLRDLSELTEVQMDQLRRHWAVVFQHNALFSCSVYENIALGLREVKGMDDAAIRPRARDVLSAVGLDYDTVADLNRDELSGGMAKRVAIARALALDPLLLFYDEPTTGLDPHLAEQIQDLLQLSHDRPTESGLARTTLVITHDKDLLHRLQPRIVLLDEGRVFFDGPYPDFMNSRSPQVRPYLERMESLHLRTITS